MSGIIHIENPELVSGVSGSGTINRLPLWTGISTLGNSALTQLGTLIGVNVAVPTAGLSLPAGTTAAASLNFATGVAPTTPNAGDLWFDGTYLYLRAGGVNQPLNAPYGTGTQDRLSKWGPGGVGLTDSVIVQDNSLGYMNTRVVTTTDTNVFALDSNAGVGRNFTFRSGGLDRFAMRVTGAESGSNAGGDWSLRRYSDAGASLGQPLTAIRADGRVYTSDNFGAGIDPGTGNAIFSLTNLVGGSGYTANATNVALTGGSGTGATASIIVSTGAVTWVGLENPGQGYLPGDVLSVTGGTGTIQVLSTSKVSRVSGMLSVTGRIGAGTAQPQAGIDSRFGARVSGWQRGAYQLTQLTPPTASLATAILGDDVDLATTSGSTSAIGALIFNRISSTGGGLSYAVQAFSSATSTAGSASYLLLGGFFGASRANPLDTNTAAVVRGVNINASVVTTGGATSFTSNVINGASIGSTVNAGGSTNNVIDMSLSGFVGAAHVINTSYTTLELYQPNAQAGIAIPLYMAINARPSGNAAATYTTYYGLRLQTPNSIITTQWGVSQESSAAKNQFFGNTGIGVDPLAGKIIASVTLTNGGSTYTNGTYSQVPLTGGSGTGATADIIVAGNVVTTVVLRAPGQGYVVGDTLSAAAANIGGTGSGLVITVATTASILRSDGTVVGSRIGAGTTSPRLSLDAVNGAMITGSASMIETNYYTSYFNSNIGAFIGGTLTPSTIYRGVYVNPLINTTSMALTTAAGLISNPNYTDSTAGSITNLTGLSSLMYRSYPNDLSTGANLTGVQSILGTRAGVGSVTSGSFTFFTGNLFHTVAGHTITTLTWYDTAATTLTGNATTTYLLRGRAFSGAGTITNRWAISQEDPLAKSAFYGNVGVGNALDVGAGKIIASLTLTNGGTGYTNGTYSQVALTGGTGTGATADIVVSGNAVTTLVLRAPGQGYVVGDVLSCASIGAGSNFQATVATVASIARADGQVVAPRIGAGTTTPRAAGDFRGQVLVDGFGSLIETAWSGQVFNFNTAFGVIGNYTPTTLFRGVTVNPLVDIRSAAIKQAFGMQGEPAITDSNVGDAPSTIGLGSFAARSYANDLATGANLYGTLVNVQVLSSLGAASTGSVWGYLANFSLSKSGHTITTAAGYDFAPGTVASTVTTLYGLRLQARAGAGVITNHWGVSQEDANAKNVLAGSTAIGLAAGTVAAAFLELAAGTTASAQIRFRTGVAPSSPAVGDFWFDGTDFRVRNGAGTQVIAYVGGSGAVSGTGTPNFLPIWNGASSLTNSPLSFSGSTLTTAASLTTIDTSVTPGLVWRLQNNGAALTIQGTSGNGTLKIDTNNRYVGIDSPSTPADKLHIAQDGVTGALAFRMQNVTAGVYWQHIVDGSGNWGLAVNGGANAVTVLAANGNVGIAQTSPSSFLSGFRNLVIGNASGGSYGLTIVADPAASSGIAFADGTAGTEPYRGFIQYLHASDDLVLATTAQEKVRIESNGRVLFGTTSSSAVARAVFQGTSASASAATDVYLQTGTAATSITNNSNLGVLSFAASGSRGAYMQAEADAGWTVSSYPTRLVFATTPSGTTAQSERLRIDSAGSFLLRQSSNPFVNAVSFNTTLQNSLVLDASGNLGVGTGSPANRIDAQGSGTRVIRCLTTDTSGAAVGVIRAEYLGGGGGANSSIDMRAGDGYAFITTNTSVPIIFGINGTDIGRFTTTGVLCIGTSSGTAASRLVARTTVGNADQMIASFDNDGATIGATGFRTSIQVLCQNTGAADTAIRLTAKAQGSGGGQTSFVEVGTDAGVDMFFVTKGVQRGYVAANDGSLVMTDNITAGVNIVATSGNITAALGNVVATAGNFVVSTSGRGVDFSATPGTGTSELLDDYEEGVWTPALGTSTVGASFTLTSVDARYTKVGRLVHIQWRIVVSSKTGAPVDVILQGLPFTHDECYVSGLIEAFNLSNTGAATANKFAHVVIWGFPGTTVFNMDLVNIDYVARDVGAQVQATTEFNGSFSYITNS